MISFHALISLLQMIAAFLIFLAGYLALFVFVILCIFTAAVIYKGADLLWAYKVKSNSEHDEVSPERKDNSGGSPELWQRFHHVFSGVSPFRSHRQQ